MEEHELIERLRLGDTQAFEAFVLAFQERILNTCYRFVNKVLARVLSARRLSSRATACRRRRTVMMTATHSIRVV